jgi:ubiquinone/menaquinone biosynthesis C-methylase UbiE
MEHLTDSRVVPALEDRKLKEIEHSRKRRTILQGFERYSDTNRTEEAAGLSSLIRDPEQFKYHFSNTKFYSIAVSSETYYHNWIRDRCRGAKALDYCCGNGENGLFMAQNGADVTGIDISPEGVANANLNAAQLGLQQRCRYVVMDAEATSFPDRSFDLIVEYGALHHLDYGNAMNELRRIVKPGGFIVCIEALRHNPIIHLYRKRTPHLRTAWEVEHIIGVGHLKWSREYFGTVKPRFFHLAALAAVPFRKTRLFRPLRRVLDSVDSVILRIPFVRRFAWQCVYILSEPTRQAPLN